MSGLEQQKNINFGAKLTGKIAGGIYYVGNTTEVTDVSGQNIWVNLGNGALTAGQFILMPIQPVAAPSSTAINDYFELRSTTGFTSGQSLWYRYGKRAVHYCSYAMSLSDPAGMPAILSFQARVVGMDTTTLATTIYPQSVRTFTVNAANVSPIQHTFPLVAESAQTFFLQIQNTGSAADVIVREAFLALYE